MSIRVNGQVIASSSGPLEKELLATDEDFAAGTTSDKAPSVKQVKETFLTKDALDNKADLDLNNTTIFSTSEGVVSLKTSTPEKAEAKEVVSADWVNNKLTSTITNCITEIPQDIKLELNDGVLTLKAGSKIWYPDGLNDDGSKKYNTFICPTDLVLQGAETGIAAAQRIVVIDTETYKWTYRYLGSSVYSGDVAPTVSNQYSLWYDTNANLIKRSTDTGVTWTTAKTSFPVCVYTRQEGGTVSGVECVFNGFGYIGSTAFALPGVKVRIPNGLDATGKPLYRPFEVERVMIYTAPSNESYAVKFYLGDLTKYGGTEFDLFRAVDIVTVRTDGNLYYDVATDRFCSWLPIASALLTNGVISSWVSYTVDPAVDGNMTNVSKAGRSVLSSFGMPSSKYIDLTLGASGQTYTAPANGWLHCNAHCIADGAYISVDVPTALLGISGSKGDDINTNLISLKSGTTFAVRYANISMRYFRFIYAEGEV